MKIEEIKKLLDGNEEAINALDDYQEQQSELTSKLNTYEVEAKSAFQKRDELKNQLKTVKDKLGLEEISDEALKKVLKGRKNNNDAELNNLKSQLEKTTKEKETIVSDYESKLSNYVLKTELTKTGLAQKALNSEVYSILEGIALKGAKADKDGNIIFLNEDGSTKYINGKQMTLKDRVSELESSEAYKPLFKAEGVSGTGANNRGGATGNGSLQRSKMTLAQKGEFISKNGQDAYLKLPN